jgi:hypothetical protein
MILKTVPVAMTLKIVPSIILIIVPAYDHIFLEHYFQRCLLIRSWTFFSGDDPQNISVYANKIFPGNDPLIVSEYDPPKWSSKLSQNMILKLLPN